MRKQHTILIGMLICLIFCTGMAIADGVFRNGGETGASYESIALTGDTTVDEVIDWLEDYTTRDMIYALNKSADLAGYCVTIDQGRTRLDQLKNQPEFEDADELLGIYDAVSSSTGNTGKSEIIGRYRALSSICSKLTYYSEHLSDLRTQYISLRASILEGNLKKDEMAKAKARMDLIEKEAKAEKDKAIKYITGAEENAGSVTEQVAKAWQWMNPSPSDNGVYNYIEAVKSLGGYLVRCEAEEIAKTEGNTTITVAAKSQILFTAVDKYDKIKGIEVTVRTKDGSVTKTATTNEKGIAYFEVSDFKPDKDRRTSVYVTFKDKNNRYRSHNYGLMDMEGGQVLSLALVKDDGTPYIIGMTLFERDMFSADDGAIVGDSNDFTDSHKICFEIEPNGKSGNLSMYYAPEDGPGKIILMNHSFSPKERNFSAESDWLNLSSKGQKYLRPDVQLMVDLQYEGKTETTDNKSQHGWFPQFKVKETKWRKDHNVSDTNEKLIMDNLVSNVVGIRIPKSIPGLGGLTITVPSWVKERYLNTRFQIIHDIWNKLEITYNVKIKDKDFSKSADKRTIENFHKANKELTTDLMSYVKSEMLLNDLMSNVKYLGSFGAKSSFVIGCVFELSSKTNQRSGKMDYYLKSDGKIGVSAKLCGEWQIPLPFVPPVLDKFLSFFGTASLGLDVGLTIPLFTTKIEANDDSREWHWKWTFKWANREIETALNFKLDLGIKFTIPFFFEARAGFMFSCKWTIGWFSTSGKHVLQGGGTFYLKISIAFGVNWQGNIFSFTFTTEGAPSATNSLLSLTQKETDGATTQRLVRYLQGKEEVLVFWVEDQGTKPKLMVRNLVNNDTRVLFESDKYPYIYDYQVLDGYFQKRIDPYAEYEQDTSFPRTLGYVGIVSAGEWAGFEKMQENIKFSDMLLQGLAEHSNGATYAFARDIDDIFTPINKITEIKLDGKSSILFNITEGDTRSNRFAATYLCKDQLQTMDTVYVCLNTTYVSDFHSSPIDTLIQARDYMATKDYAVPVYTLQTQGKKTRLCIVKNAKDQRTEVCYYQVEGKGLNAIRVDLPADEKVLYVGSEFLFGENLTENPDSILSLITEKSVVTTDGGATETEYIRRKLNGESGIPLPIEMPDGSLGYQTLRYTTPLGYVQQYIWWMQAYSVADSNGNPVERYRVKASMVDARNGIFSPAFNLIENLEEPFDYLLFDRYSQKFVLVKNGATKASECKFVQVKTVPMIESFISEQPAIEQGKTFNMYFRLRNDSSIILDSATIDITAVPVIKDAADKRQKVLLQSDQINLRNPEESSVTHYDYMLEDNVIALGANHETADQVLTELAADQMKSYTEYGPNTVVRLTDFDDDFLNVNTIYDITYDNQGEIQRISAKKVDYFMPGNVGTFRALIGQNATAALKTWVGEYTLLAEVHKFGFRLSPDENAQRYMAVLNENTDPENKQDTYTFYLLDHEGNTVGSGMSAEADILLGQFDVHPNTKSKSDTDKDDSIAYNEARQNSLKTSNAAWAIAEHNDYEIDTHEFLQDGKRMLEIQMRNDALASAPDITPKLIAQIQYIDENWKNTGWSMTLNGMDLDTGFTRSLIVPFDEIVNGQKYERLRIGLVSTDTNDVAQFYDLNDYNNYDELYTNGDFWFTKQPEDLTVCEGEPASFECEVTGMNGPYTYEWVVCYPNNKLKSVGSGKLTGNRMTLDLDLIRSALAEKEGGSEYRIDKTTLADDSMTFWCVVSDCSGYSVMSDKALLTVLKKPAPTGDDMDPVLWLVIGMGSLCLLAVLLRKRGRARRDAR